MSVPLKINLKLTYSLENGYSNRQSIIVHKGKYESLTHIILKLLAFLYFYRSDKNLLIEPKFRYRGFKPDLVAYKDPEIPQELQPDIDIWIECKKVKISKLKKLARYLPTSTIYWFRLNHSITKKSKNILETHNVNLVEVRIKERERRYLENRLETQSPIWNVRQREDAKLLIETQNKDICVEFQAILPVTSVGSKKEKIW